MDTGECAVVWSPYLRVVNNEIAAIGSSANLTLFPHIRAANRQALKILSPISKKLGGSEKLSDAPSLRLRARDRPPVRTPEMAIDSTFAELCRVGPPDQRGSGFTCEN